MQISYDNINNTIYYVFDFYEDEKEIIFHENGKFTLGRWWWVSMEDDISAGESVPDEYHPYPTYYTSGTSFSGIDFYTNYMITINQEITSVDECENFSTAEIWFRFGNSEPHPTGKNTLDISNLATKNDILLSISQPSKTTINYKDGIVLSTELKNIPDGATIEWTTDNDNFKLEKTDDGKTLTAISDKNGTTVFTATLYDANGDLLAKDTIELTSKAGFFQKFVGFFKSLFGLTKIFNK